jgi:hypothetical protein
MDNKPRSPLPHQTALLSIYALISLVCDAIRRNYALTHRFGSWRWDIERVLERWRRVDGLKLIAGVWRRQ